MFCGVCGAAANALARDSSPAATAVQADAAVQAGPGFPPPWPSWQPSAGTREAARQQAQEVAERPPDGFFTHATGQRRGPLSNATRYLCAAAYLDPTYPNTRTPDMAVC